MQHLGKSLKIGYPKCMKTKTYNHLSQDERIEITILKAQGKSIRYIAKTLKRDPSTISRELKRNAPPVYSGYYRGHKAHERAIKRKSQAHKRKRLKIDKIRAYVAKKLLFGWTPEQISGRISNDHTGFSISHEAIYQYIYKERTELIPLLPRSHKKRKKRGQGKKHKNLHIPNRVSINDRPKYIEKRKQIGHWESDTVISRQSKFALLVILERKTRFIIMNILHQKTSQQTKNCIINRLISFPDYLRRTITYDNGSENTEHEKVNHILHTNSYFCNPYHSWEKGSVEYAISLIRRYFPKKTDFAKLSKIDIETVETLLNNRPRKCLNYSTPLEILTKECCT